MPSLALRGIIDKVQALRDELELLQSEEADYAENMPENMQGSEKHERAEEAADALSEAVEYLENAVEYIEGAIE